MARSDAQRDRQLYRKTQSMLEQTHGGYAGKSTIEKLEDELDKAMNKHLDAKAAGDVMVAKQTRGEVRGLARAVGMMKSPYYPIQGLKEAETASASRVRRSRHAAEQSNQEQAEVSE